MSAGHDPNQHLAAAVDLAASTRTTMRLSRFSRALFDDPTWYTGAWDNLLVSTRRHEGPAIWSSEAFTYLDDEGVTMLADTLRPIPAKVVVVRRDMTSQLISGYLESARHDVIPPFEDYVRRVMETLLGQHPYEFDYLDLQRIRSRWAPVGPVTTVGDAQDP